MGRSDRDRDIGGKIGQGSGPHRTFGELLDRYILEVLPTKRGERPERLRLERIKRLEDIARVRLPEFGPEHVAAWRDKRLRQVSAASVAQI
jgi:hypothetical protein